MNPIGEAQRFSNCFLHPWYLVFSSEYLRCPRRYLRRLWRFPGLSPQPPPPPPRQPRQRWLRISRPRWQPPTSCGQCSVSRHPEVITSIHTEGIKKCWYLTQISTSKSSKLSTSKIWAVCQKKLSFSDVCEKKSIFFGDNDLEWLRLICYHSRKFRNNEKLCKSMYGKSIFVLTVIGKNKKSFWVFVQLLTLLSTKPKKKHFNLGNWRSQVAWLVFWTSSSLEQAGMSKTCGYSFIEIRNNQISGPTVVWAPLPSVRSNQPASFIFQERASQFTCFYQLSVLKWKIRGLNLSSSYRITLLMYNMPNSKR